MNFNVLIIGKKKDKYPFLQICLQGLPINCSFVLLPELTKNFSLVNNAHVIIVDAVPFREKQLTVIHTLREVLPRPQLPILVILPERPLRLRYRVVELGATDYITVPFTPLDFRLRLQNLLRTLAPPSRTAQAEEHFSPRALQILYSGLELLLQDPLRANGNKKLAGLLRNLQQILQAYGIFLFNVTSNQQLTLQLAVPDNPAVGNWTIPVESLPTVVKAVKLKEPTILNRVTAENHFLLYLRSYLNVEVRSFLIYPIQVREKTVAVLLVLRTDEQFISDFHYQVVRFFSRLFEWIYLLQNIRGQLQEAMDNRIWKFTYQFLDRIMNQLNFGILVVSKTELRVLYLNQIAAQLLRVSPDVATYKRLNDILDEQNIQTILEAQKLSSSTYERPELVLQDENGEKILVGFTIQEYRDENEGTAGYILSLKDITYSKELQEEMRRMERLASLGVMASGIAHEIRNPLAGIKAMAQTFEEELDPQDPKIEYVKRIIRQVNRLDEMLKSLFSYAKPQKPNRNFCQVESLLKDVIGLLRQKIREHNIHITESYSPGLPQIYVDQAQMQQVFMNLILNSIEAIEKDGEIFIGIEPAEKASKQFSRKPFYGRIVENPYVMVTIRDNGCGISPENLKQIFNPFFTTKTFGTGLGLSIVYQIVKENDGIIYFESEVGKGTTCYLFLPAFHPADLGLEKKGQPHNDQIRHHI